MRSSRFVFLTFFLIMFGGAAVATAQSADARSPLGRPDKEELPKSVQEMLFKMQVDQAKKDYQELLDRGEELLAITDQLEKTIETKGTLAANDLDKLAAAEKLAKKIRGELGGDDDDEAAAEPPKIKDKTDGIKYLRKQAGDLMDELKKTTRFSISVVAIQSSNAVLRLVRFLRTGN